MMISALSSVVVKMLDTVAVRITTTITTTNSVVSTGSLTARVSMVMAHSGVCHRHYATSSSISYLPTIYSLSSGPSKSGVAVIRVSGTRTSQALMKLCNMNSLPKPRYAILTKIYCQHGENPGGLLDKGLVVWFPGPRSYTGEDLCEFHVHGSVAVIRALQESLGSLNGLEPAEPGDFTRRAFINKKLDLSEVEALSDLIQSETEAQRKIYVRQFDGELRKLYQRWTSVILKCVANIEALIDFSEDEIIDPSILDEVDRDVELLRREIKNHLGDARRGEMLRTGVRVAIIGKPNVGKSSFINLISQRELSIVSPLSGTTRDVIESAIDIGGYPIILSDTAGLHDSPADQIEQEGVRRARAQMKKADLIIWMVDMEDVIELRNDLKLNLSSVFIDLINENKQQVTNCLLDENDENLDESDLNNKKIIYILNKVDVISEGSQFPTLVEHTRQLNNVLLLSCKTKEGLDSVLDLLKVHVKDLCGDPSCGSVTITQTRQHYHLKQSLLSLEQYKTWKEMDLMAEELRIALFHISKITGRVGAEDILDVIFRDFCIGK